MPDPAAARRNPGAALGDGSGTWGATFWSDGWRGAAILHASGDHFKLQTPANSRNGKTFHAINAYRRYPGTPIYVLLGWP